MATVNQQPTGHISRDEVYTLDEIKKRLGLSSYALRQARRNGLNVRYVGRRGFIAGQDAMTYIERSMSRRGT